VTAQGRSAEPLQRRWEGSATHLALPPLRRGALHGGWSVVGGGRTTNP